MNNLKKYIPNEIEILKKELERTNDWKELALIHSQINYLKKQMSNILLSFTSEELDIIKWFVFNGDYIFSEIRKNDFSGKGQYFISSNRKFTSILEREKTIYFDIKNLEIKLYKANSSAYLTKKTKQ